MSNSTVTPVVPRPVTITLPGVQLQGDLTFPSGASSIVVFAHGSGSSRLSARNRWVAEQLVEAGHATLLFDLLTREEEAWDARNASLRFDIRLLAGRLVGATTWLSMHDATRELRVGYFGASTGAAAALVAAAALPERISAVVSRGGRPDLAGTALAQVRAPTLLIVGGSDREVLALNRAALAQLTVQDKKLVIVPGASHLFEEPGALSQAARAAREWCDRWLAPKPSEATKKAR